MKLIFSLIVLLCSLNVFASNDKDIQNVMKQSMEAWNRGDMNSFLTYYKKSDDVQYISTQIISGYENIKNHYMNEYPNHKTMGTLTFKLKDIKQLSSHYAFVIGTWQLSYKNNHPSAASGVFTLLFEKINNDWKIIVDHSS